MWLQKNEKLFINLMIDHKTHLLNTVLIIYPFLISVTKLELATYLAK